MRPPLARHRGYQPCPSPCRGGWGPGGSCHRPPPRTSPPVRGPPPPTGAAQLLAEPSAWHSHLTPSPAAQPSPVSGRSPAAPAWRLGCPHVRILEWAGVRAALSLHPGEGWSIQAPPPQPRSLCWRVPLPCLPLRIRICTCKPAKVSLPPASDLHSSPWHPVPAESRDARHAWE